MKKITLLLGALALVAAACGGSAESTATTDLSPGATTSAGAGDEITTTTGGDAASTDTTAPSSDDTTAPSSDDTTTTGAAAPEPEGDPAPDFTLALGDGSEFVLSAEQKPVYLVFWAEW